MATANPLFDPGWREKYSARLAECARWEKISGQIAAQDGFGAPRHLAAMAAHRAAKAAAAQAHLAQFATIADYAAWRFAALPDKHGAGLVMDFEAFASIDAVDEAFRRAGLRNVENPLVDEMSLPVRQPAGLAAFGDSGAVLSSWRRFIPAEIGIDAAGAEACDCLVSFQHIGEAFHVCLAHRWGGLSSRARDQFRNIATILARQAIEIAIPEAGMLFQDGRHRLAEHRDLIRRTNEMAAKFRFYRHLLPRRDLKEQFCLVTMTWDGARFIDPDFSAALYESLPAALRAAEQTPEPARLPGPGV
jgi:hypothetical protein